MTLSWRQRARLRWARARRWEFWPAWLFYIPIVIWIILLGLRHRHFTLFTAANPGMDGGGVVGERKSPLLLSLREREPELTPALALLPAAQPAAQKQRIATEFVARHGLPVVAKPDIGQRGRGVLIAQSAEALAHYLSAASEDIILQAYAGGAEYGLFVYRDPISDQACLYSITAKELISVSGDGQHSLAELIWQHPRAWLMAGHFFQRHAERLHETLPRDEEYALVDVGSHCRGALFLDASELASPALQEQVERLLAAMPGFHFGRLDIKAPDREALRQGKKIKVLEVNGVTAEAAHVYHPGTPLWQGYRSFFRQWQLAFQIGRRNRAGGADTVSPWQLLQLFRQDLRRYAQAEQRLSQAQALN